MVKNKIKRNYELALGINLTITSIEKAKESISYENNKLVITLTGKDKDKILKELNLLKT
ncbi:MAG: hypothetical protein LBM93_03825 [Oscillospiraceae bacterium]|nr:hypothetical protein [Oscillospiraceae bacterium]